MKKIFSTLLLFFLMSATNADELENVLNKVYDKGSETTKNYITNFLDGPGDTEVSIGQKRNKERGFDRPTGSIMIVRPFNSDSFDKNSVLFYQAQLNSYHLGGDTRQSLNYGIGKRFLSDDKSHFWGINTFYDLDTKRNHRLGFGSEFKASNFNVNGNYYLDVWGVEQNVDTTKERVLNGYDINISGQVPHVPWANVTYNNYTWLAQKAAQNSEGEMYSGIFNLSNEYTLEVGVDDNNLMSNRTFAKLIYTLGAKKRPNLNDGLTSIEAFQDSDVSKDMLTKVKRSNIITLEIEGTGVVIANGN